LRDQRLRTMWVIRFNSRRGYHHLQALRRTAAVSCGDGSITE